MNESRALGDYTLIKQIGQGSLGQVYLAEHRFMKRQYVLKILPEELASDRGFIQRFEEDVALLTQLDHPNIVKTHTVSSAQGQYFLVTDCVVDEFGETTNLNQHMLSRGSRFPEETLFRLLKQLAEALDYAHNKNTTSGGIIHRNLKLNNILVAKGRGGIDLIISDFGLSRVIGPAAVLTRTFKTVSEILGIADVLYQPKMEMQRYPNNPLSIQQLTPLHQSFLQNFAFLAPEQRKIDRPEGVTIKTDVYAFGILTYYLLTGEFPLGYFEMPSAFGPEITWDWDQLVTSCLHADPNKRPESLVDALDAVRLQSSGLVSAKVSPLIPKETENKEIKSPEKPAVPPLQQIPDHAFFHLISESVAPATSPAEAIKPLVQGPEMLRPIIRSAQIERPGTDLNPAQSLVIDNTVKQYTPEFKEIKNPQPLLTDMIVIAGGAFVRGSKEGNRDEMPRHQVLLDSFAIDIHPVTNEQFVRFLDVMGGEKDTNHQDIIRMRDSRIKRAAGKLSIESGYAKHPVVGVTWYGAVAYAKWVGKRLPTEAEWEAAARGSKEGFLYPTGDEIEKSQANFFSSDTTSAMSYAPNAIGLYDMVGNVYEWCHDWYGYNYYEVSVQEPENPKGPIQGVYRVLRGGCWKSLKEDLRCSRRHRNNPGTVNSTYGFRCAADVQ